MWKAWQSKRIKFQKLFWNKFLWIRFLLCILPNYNENMNFPFSTYMSSLQISLILDCGEWWLEVMKA